MMDDSIVVKMVWLARDGTRKERRISSIVEAMKFVEHWTGADCSLVGTTIQAVDGAGEVSLVFEDSHGRNLLQEIVRRVHGEIGGKTPGCCISFACPHCGDQYVENTHGNLVCVNPECPSYVNLSEA